jgi:hypothetical protein
MKEEGGEYQMTKQMKLGLGATTAGVLVALASLLVLTGIVFAVTGASAAVSQPTADATGNATATLTMTAPTGSAVGNWAFDVGYTAADYVGAPTCTTSQGDCAVNPTGSPGVVRFGGFASGLSGTTTVGTIVFKTNLTTAGACSNLTLAIAAASGSKFQDATATDFDSPTFTAGKVCVAAVTNSPSPSASPVVTAKTVPATGGPAGDSSSISLSLLLGAAGLVVVAGGAWTVARARREEN